MPCQVFITTTSPSFVQLAPGDERVDYAVDKGTVELRA
jgi:hypothetical protein